MLKFALLFICFATIEGRNIQRVIRDEGVNATDPELKNATESADDAPDVTELQADLVAPASGPKPLEAKYTIRVKPKLKDGVPQIQEIRIMPPKGNSTKGFVKPLMVLKQNVTKPLIENIEIDVPEKGVKFASKPSVEVIEGNHKEMMKVSKGQVVVENAAQKSDTNSEDKQAKHQDEAASQPSTSQNATDSASSQKAPKQSTSQDVAEKNATTSTQKQAAPQTQASAAPQNTVNTYQAAPQTQPSAQAAPVAPVYSQPAPLAPAPPAPAAYSSVPQTCTDDSVCRIYPDDRCREQWLMTNCRLKCKLCSK
ncbi:uncharacterized protein LOC144657408 isoform X2 [Oculina patagonica]